MDSNRYTATYQNYSSDNSPTLKLQATSNVTNYENNEDFQVTFSSRNFFSRRHMSENSTTSTDTQSSTKNLVMAEQLGESSPLKETHSDPFSIPSCLRHLGGLQIIITSMVIFSIGITIALIVQIYVGPPQVTPHGGIVSSNSYCSKLGLDLLKSEKASSIDAAVLTALCLCVIHPHAAGIGGGGFAVVHNQKIVENATTVYDFREKSPEIFSNQSVRDEFFEGKTSDEISPVLTFAVPGVLQGLRKLHLDYGKLPWAQIVNQIANITQAGVVVSGDLAKAIEVANISSWNSELRNLFFNDSSKKVEGDLIQQPKLAKLLQLIASKGVDPFYSGDFSKNLADQIAAEGGFLTETDMKAYKAETNRNVNETRFSGVKIITPGPPSSGFALHTVMKTISEYENPDQTSEARFLQVHRLIEAIKFSLGFGTNLGDPLRPDYTAPSFFTNQSLSKGIKEKINDFVSFNSEHYLHGFQPLRLTESNQQYLALIGPDAFAVVITLSVGSAFGSGVMFDGVLMNDAMKDFSWTGRNRNSSTFDLPPSEANYLRGGVRPMSAMIPMLAIPAVSKCGFYILPVVSATNLSLSAVAQTLVEDKDLQSLDQSINRPRFDQHLSSIDLLIENDTNVELIAFLRNRNHSIHRVPNNFLGSVSAVQWLKNIVSVFTDERDLNLRNTAFVF